MSIKDKNHIPEMVRHIQGLSKRKIRVGILGKDGDIAEYAAYNEFGVEGKIPERSFLRTAFDNPSNKEKAFKFAKEIFKRTNSPATILRGIGVSMTESVRANIRSNIPPANAPQTIERKGSSHTLIDTGRMIQAVSHVVV